MSVAAAATCAGIQDHRFSSATAWAEALAHEIAKAPTDAIAQRGVASLVVSGGARAGGVAVALGRLVDRLGFGERDPGR